MIIENTIVARLKLLLLLKPAAVLEEMVVVKRLSKKWGQAIIIIKAVVAALIAISVIYYATVKIAVMVANAMDAITLTVTVIAADERVKQRLLPLDYY